MKTFATILEYVTSAGLTVLALITLRQWRERKDESTRWVMLTFTSLAAVALFGLVFPEEGEGFVYNALNHVLVLVVLLFPYFLYRIGASFAGPTPTLDKVAAGITAAVMLVALIQPDFPQEGEERPSLFVAFIVAVLAQWVFLSTVVAVRFWRAGRGQKNVAGKRMKMLSVASVALSVAIVISGSAGNEESALVEEITQVIVVLSIGSFFLAFAPPEWLRAFWRRSSQEDLRRGVIDMMSAGTIEQVTQGLLPHAARVVGSEGIALIDDEGKILGSYGISEDVTGYIAKADLATAEGESQMLAPHLMLLRFGFGSLLVHTNPYTPFFGHDEIELLGSLGVVANLAVQRVEASDIKLQLAESKLRRKQALEINDNIVQGLAVAKYAFEAGQTAEGMAAVEGTLAAARAIISNLLEEIGRDQPLAPGSLVRDEAAPNFSDFLER
jgi:hypothetical protein